MQYTLSVAILNVKLFEYKNKIHGRIYSACLSVAYNIAKVGHKVNEHTTHCEKIFITSFSTNSDVVEPRHGTARRI